MYINIKNRKKQIEKIREERDQLFFYYRRSVIWRTIYNVRVNCRNDWRYHSSQKYDKGDFKQWKQLNLLYKLL